MRLCWAPSAPFQPFVSGVLKPLRGRMLLSSVYSPSFHVEPKVPSNMSPQQTHRRLLKCSNCPQEWRIMGLNPFNLIEKIDQESGTAHTSQIWSTFSVFSCFYSQIFYYLDTRSAALFPAETSDLLDWWSWSVIRTFTFPSGSIVKTLVALWFFIIRSEYKMCPTLFIVFAKFAVKLRDSSHKQRGNSYCKHRNTMEVSKNQQYYKCLY